MSLARAIETGDLAQLPSRRDEDWRWTDLRGLIRQMPPPSPASTRAAGAGPFAGLADEEFVLVNGAGPGQLAVAAGDRRCVALRLVAAGEAGAHTARFEIDVAADAELTLLESYEGEAADYVSECDIKVEIGAGARVERIILAQDGAAAISVSRAEVRLSPRAIFGQTVVTCGARRQRLETEVWHLGGGALARLDGVYLLGQARHADITTVVTHAGVDGRTDQLIKGVVADQARGVFQGRIVVSRGADRSDAKMAHHGLVLSDRAEIDAKPELEIYADDVACAHGNTVGALDEEALFYARQRGIPGPAARAMLMEAFLVEGLGRIVHDGARDVARAWLGRRLEVAP